jgi:hypothetical protein
MTSSKSSKASDVTSSWHTTRRAIAAAVSLLLIAACGYDVKVVTAPNPFLATLSLTLADPVVEVGQFTRATANPRDQFGTPFNGAVVVFTSTNSEVAGVNPLDGRILAVALGTTTIIATSGERTDSRELTVTFPPIFINEIAPSGDAADGWVELFNPTGAAVDLTGWTMTKADVFVSVTLPAGASIPAHGYYVVDESLLPDGLKPKDQVRLFSRFGVKSDQFSWGHNPVASYSRCFDGESGFTESEFATKGVSNRCS